MTTFDEKMTAQEGRANFVVQGIVIPVAWDEKGNIVQTALATAAEESFLVEPKGKGMDMARLVRDRVTLVGQVRQEGDKRIIEVDDYWLG